MHDAHAPQHDCQCIVIHILSLAHKQASCALINITEGGWEANSRLNVVLYYYIAGLKQYTAVQKDRNTRDHLVWTIGNRGPMHEVCILHN